MADEDHEIDPDDVLADGVASAGPTLPFVLTLPALALTVAIALPLHPDGYSFAQMLAAVFQRSPLEALIMLLGFGAPFCFGAIVLAIAGLGARVSADFGLRALVFNLAMLHAQLILFAGMLVSRGIGMKPVALLGYAIVSGGWFIFQRARTADGTADAGATQREMVRWGASVILAICAWARMQTLIGVRLGWAVEVMIAACVAMSVLLLRHRR